MTLVFFQPLQYGVAVESLVFVLFALCSGSFFESGLRFRAHRD